MATFNFNSFKTTIPTNQGYLYSDLHLDIQQQVLLNPGVGNGVPGKDMYVDYDLNAIRNSLINLFTTLPGQRILEPEYGLNLLKYVFAPVSKEYGDLIGNDILRSIQRWEPRVEVQKVAINALPDQNEYDVGIAVYVPAFKTYTSLIGKLGSKGFSPINLYGNR